jgi:hypothetical protein
MPIFYKKTLPCGCAIIALTVSHVTSDTYLLGGHTYNYICLECKLNLSEELLDDRLENIYKNDNLVSKNNNNNWIIIKTEASKVVAAANIRR